MYIFNFVDIPLLLTLLFALIGTSILIGYNIYKNIEGPYKDGYLYGLKLNIEELQKELKTNE